MVYQTEVGAGVDERGVEIIVCFETDKEIEDSIRKSKMQIIEIIDGDERFTLTVNA